MITRELSQTEIDAVENRHKYHKPASPDVAANHEEIRRIAKDAELAILRLIPPGRAAALVATKMDELRMWANMAIATAPNFGA